MTSFFVQAEEYLNAFSSEWYLYSMYATPCTTVELHSGLIRFPQSKLTQISTGSRPTRFEVISLRLSGCDKQGKRHR